MGIIIALIIALIIVVVVITAIQQRNEKALQEKRAKSAKQKAIIDETEELFQNLANLPTNPVLVLILNTRILNATKIMAEISPGNKLITRRVKDMEELIQEGKKENNQSSEQTFTLPDNEATLVSVLQSIKKIRVILKSEQAKGNLDAQTFTEEDNKLSGMQLKISVESLQKRGMVAYQKGMLGSARQYFEKAVQTISTNPLQTEYCTAKREEIEKILTEITSTLKNTNASDVAKKAKDEEDDLDLLFQPKKKW